MLSEEKLLIKTSSYMKHWVLYTMFRKL